MNSTQQCLAKYDQQNSRIRGSDLKYEEPAVESNKIQLLKERQNCSSAHIQLQKPAVFLFKQQVKIC